MKICAIICEYNPFHNGHLYQIQEAKRLSGADAILCIMSGNFVQRGESAIINKFTRAKHAVLSGADAVIELPTIFATSNAELFAKGAIHILSSIPSVSTLCFGCENADKEMFLNAAKLLNNEPKEISEKIKTLMASGISYAKARAQAWNNAIPDEFLNCPNNILGLEYTKAILSKKASIDILPIQRMGAGYNENTLNEVFSSASAIRNNLDNKIQLKNQLPDYVLADLPAKHNDNLDMLEKYAILYRSKDEIAKVCDCNEGLENAFKKAANANSTLCEALTSARYTSSRIRRIALQNLLNIEEDLIRNALTSALFLRVLAIRNSRQDLLTALSESAFTLIIRARDEEKLPMETQPYYERDIFAEKVFNLMYPTPTDKNIFI